MTGTALKPAFTALITFVLLWPMREAGAAGKAASSHSVAEQLVGGWRLASRTTTTETGQPIVDAGLSATPAGILFYDRTGAMAAQLSRPGRTLDMLPGECSDAQKIKGTNDTAQTVLGYDAYFGTYTVNEEGGYVVHHLANALFPGDIGKYIKRYYSLSGNTLKLKFSTTLRNGTKVIRTLVWERLK